MASINPFNRKANLKKTIVGQGLFESELKSLLAARLTQEGFSTIQIRNRASKIEIILFSVETQNVLGDGGRLFNEINTLIGQRFGLAPNDYRLYVDRVPVKGLCAAAQADSVKFKLLEGIKARRAALSVMDFVMKNQAHGVEVNIAGKLRGQRAKTVKFKSGYMVKSGEAKNYYVDEAIRSVHMKQGVLGVRVRIQKPHDPTGRIGPKKPLPDVWSVKEPVEEEEGEDEDVDVCQEAVVVPEAVRAPRDVDRSGMIPQGVRAADV